MALKLADAFIRLTIDTGKLRPQSRSLQRFVRTEVGKLNKLAVITPRMNLAPLKRDIGVARGMMLRGGFPVGAAGFAAGRRGGGGGGGRRGRAPVGPGTQRQFFVSGAFRQEPLRERLQRRRAAQSQQRQTAAILRREEREFQRNLRQAVEAERRAPAVGRQTRFATPISGAPRAGFARRTGFATRGAAPRRGHGAGVLSSFGRGQIATGGATRVATGRALTSGAFGGFASGSAQVATGILGAQAALTAIAAPVKGIQAFAGFEDAIINVKRLQSELGATTEQMRQLEAQAREMGRTTIFTAVESADAMALLSQRGFDANQIMQITPRAANLAASAQIDLAQATEIASSVFLQQQANIEDTQRIIDVLAKASITSAADVEKLGMAFRFVGPLAKFAGLSLEETTSLLANLINVGQRAGQAGRGLNQLLAQLGKPAKQQDFVEQFGVALEDAQGEFRPFADIVADVNEQFEGLTSKERLTRLQSVFRVRAARAFVGLLTAGADSIREMDDNLADFEGTAARQAEKRLESLTNQLTVLNSKLNDLGIAFGEELQEDLKSIVRLLGLGADAATTLVQAFGSLRDMANDLLPGEPFEIVPGVQGADRLARFLSGEITREQLIRERFGLPPKDSEGGKPEGKQTGGVVRGTGGPDSQLIAASPGEAVLTRQQQMRLGGPRALAAAGVPGFQGGGRVSPMSEDTRFGFGFKGLQLLFGGGGGSDSDGAATPGTEIMEPAPGFGPEAARRGRQMRERAKMRKRIEDAQKARAEEAEELKKQSEKRKREARKRRQQSTDLQSPDAFLEALTGGASTTGSSPSVIRDRNIRSGGRSAEMLRQRGDVIGDAIEFQATGTPGGNLPFNRRIRQRRAQRRTPVPGFPTILASPDQIEKFRRNRAAGPRMEQAETFVTGDSPGAKIFAPPEAIERARRNRDQPSVVRRSLRQLGRGLTGAMAAPLEVFAGAETGRARKAFEFGLSPEAFEDERRTAQQNRAAGAPGRVRRLREQRAKRLGVDVETLERMESRPSRQEQARERRQERRERRRQRRDDRQEQLEQEREEKRKRSRRARLGRESGLRGKELRNFVATGDPSQAPESGGGKPRQRFDSRRLGIEQLSSDIQTKSLSREGADPQLKSLKQIAKHTKQTAKNTKKDEDDDGGNFQ